ncbi:MAG TPA: hypothetical protein VI382_04105, partial [Candidatus Manganitrophaceae bacterium]|nr:hypothetical protein [Candidatus Manganitrophaceae bacterium]
PDTVVAVGVIVPNEELLTANETDVPSGTLAPVLVVTVAATVAVPDALKAPVGVTVAVIVAGAFVPVDWVVVVEPVPFRSVTEESSQPAK